MTRAVPEWVASHDDQAIPSRVKLRLFEAYNGCCAECGRPLVGRDLPEYDHIQALVNGGEHRESNLQALCPWCHLTKSRVDVALKSKNARVAKKRIGAATPSRNPLAGSKRSGWKKPIHGPAYRRES